MAEQETFPFRCPAERGRGPGRIGGRARARERGTAAANHIENVEDVPLHEGREQWYTLRDDNSWILGDLG